MARRTIQSNSGSASFWKKFAPWLIVGFSFAIYSNTLSNKYNMDDDLVTRNHRLTSGGISSLVAIFLNRTTKMMQGMNTDSGL